MNFRLMTLGAALVSTLWVAACKKSSPPVERGDTPPPAESAQLGRCSQGGGTVTDPATAGFFARTLGEYCIDPNSETRAYGKSAPGTLDQVCTELFDGECEVYRVYGLERVVTVRYADAKGSTSTVNVVLSRFETPRGAYGFFTKRLVADSDPADTKSKPLQVGGAGALASTIAYVWRGAYVAELTYVNDAESPDVLRQSASLILPVVAKSLGTLVPGDTSLPDTAGLLPSEGRIPLGIVYEPRDLLGVQGVGPGSMGFYAAQDKRYRVALLERPDEASAQDILKTLKKLPGATETKTRVPAVTVTVHGASDASKSDWLFARQGNRIVGIGDEELVMAQMPADQARERCLSRERKLERLTQVVESLKNQGAPTAKPAASVDPSQTMKE